MGKLIKNLVLHVLIPSIVAAITYWDGATASVSASWGELSNFNALWFWYIIVSFSVRGFWRLVDDLIPSY